jgi:hypothetical protein
MNPYLTVINSRAEITGEDGYGTYVIGNATEYFMGAAQTTIQPPYFYAYADADDYKMLGEVTNTPQAAVNNGVIMSLVNGSKWTVSSTCFLSSLTVQAGSSIVALPGYTVTPYDDSVVSSLPLR